MKFSTIPRVSARARLPERFIAKVNVNGPFLWGTPCWQWTAAKKESGFGVYRNDDGRNVSAHRYVYELLVGPLDEGVEVWQRCGNRLCVNLDHLAERTKLQRLHESAKPFCRRGHELVNAYFTPSGIRMCRECNRIRDNKRRRRRPTIPAEMRARVMAGQPCAYCGRANPRTIDHIIPNADRQRFGIDFLDERYMVACCLGDNSMKGTRRLLPPSWASRVEEMNAAFPGAPWRVWRGGSDEPAFREVHS